MLEVAQSIFILDPSKRCALNALLFTRAVNFFLVNGYEVAQNIDDSSVILINSCCVNSQKVDGAVAAVETARAHGTGKRILLFGCLPTLPSAPLNRQEITCVGPKEIDLLDSLFPHRISIHHISANRLPKALYLPGQGLGYEDYHVLIAQGCANHCSYCNIHLSKGRVQSEPIDSIVAQVLRGIAQGATQFALLADDCASYGLDIGTNLVHLIERLFAAVPDFRIKLGYLYPSFLLKHREALKPLFATGRISFANIPIQSGSQRLLGLMNRSYSVDAILQAIDQVHAISPGTILCTHLMINFPTETREDFHSTLAVAEHFHDALFLHFSDNEGTPAASLVPKVPADEARLRWDIASEYANRRMPGRGFVITDFNCDVPYNVTRRAP